MLTLRAAFPTRRTADADAAPGVGDDAAFARLWEAERARVWRLTARLSGDADAADDLTQEAGFRALEAWAGFRGRAAGGTWLYRIAVNVVLRWREKEARDRTARAPDADPDTAAAPDGIGMSPEGILLRADAVARTRRAVDSLPDDLRTPLLLYAWEGLKYREIADLLYLPPGTVMTRLYNARQRLRRELGEDADAL